MFRRMPIRNRQLQIAHKVGRMSSSSQNPPSRRSAVNGAGVTPLTIGFKVLHSHGNQILKAHLSIQHLRQLFIQQLGVLIPAGPFNIEPIQVTAIFRRRVHIPFGTVGRDRLVIKSKSINRDLVLAGEILLHSSKEAVGKVEAADPEAGGRAVVNPFLEHREAFYKIKGPTAERLKGGVGHLSPAGGYFVVYHRIEHIVQFITHRDQSVHGFSKAFQRGENLYDHPVITDQFLLQHSVHTFFVLNRVLLAHFQNIKRTRQFSQHFVTFVLNNVLQGCPTASHGPRQKRKDHVALFLTFIDSGTDFRIVVHSEDFRTFQHRQSFYKLEVAFK